MRTIIDNRVVVYGTPMSSLENALKILALLSKERPVLRVGEVCRELSLPKSSVSRLLKTLNDYGLVERESRDLGYIAGRQTLALADLHLANRSLLQLIDTALDSFVSEFQFVAYAAVLSGPDITILRVRSGSHPLRLVHDVGRSMPALPTALGITLLARETDETVLEIFADEVQLESDRKQILKIITDARKTGVVSLVRPSISALGATIYDPNRDEKIALSISYPTAAATEPLVDRMLQRMHEEAHRIGVRVGDPYWSKRGTGTEHDPLSNSPRGKIWESADTSGL